MLKPNQTKSYANRPLTPLGDASGLTSTPVSQVPSRKNSPPRLDPYMYQPAITWTHPSVVPNSSSNYAQAVSAAETIIEITEVLPLVGEKFILPNQPSDASSPGAESLRKATKEGQNISKK